jgi:ABC-type multidrug transport system fused ATPase/permease subunit
LRHESEVKVEKEVPVNSKNKEVQAEVTLESYFNYLFLTPGNKFLFSVTIVLFLVSEGINMAYMRFLAMHNSKAMSNSLLADENLYWLTLGMMQVSYFILSWFRYFFLNIVILFSNEKLHELMIEGLVRSPTSFFDTTPSGRLINTFSNDLGLLDMTLAFSFTDMIEGPIVSISMLVNIFTIEL